MAAALKHTTTKSKTDAGDYGPARRPEIYRFHDYREFLKAWISHLKSVTKGFSVRSLAKQAGLASGYLPMVLGGSRHLSSKALAKLAPVLGLSQQERSYFELLVQLGTADSQHVRLHALDRMKRHQGYQRLNPRELEVYQYLTHWYYVAIREMAALPGFKPDAEWIQGRLKVHVPLADIKTALRFLTENGFIELLPEGGVRPPTKNLDCLGGVFRVALTQFHHEMFDLASKSIENTPSDERNLMGHTFTLSSKHFEEARKILTDALERVRSLGQSEKEGDSIYHLELALFPLTKKENV